ncbi:MAG TPA: hypothetical protein VM537_05235 [Anaerolineae bacterium]|nr:hypothetical protein [Anaerolineae bacterium]
MTNEPGRAAWLCPGCHFQIGWIDENNNLVIWRWPTGEIVLRCGTFVCSCGYIVHWIEAKVPTGLDKDAVPMVQ